MGSKDKGRANEDYFRKLADQDRTDRLAALEVAKAPTKAGARIENSALAVDDWQHGVGPDGKPMPIDVKNLPGGGPMMEIYKTSAAMEDAGRQGLGLNSVSDGANPNFAAALNAENAQTRKGVAQGQLEESVNRAIADKDAKLGYLDSSGTNKNLSIAGLTQSAYDSDQNRFMSYLMSREARPSFLRTLSQSFASKLGNTLAAPPIPAGA